MRTWEQALNGNAKEGIFSAKHSIMCEDGPIGAEDAVYINKHAIEAIVLRNSFRTIPHPNSPAKYQHTNLK